MTPQELLPKVKENLILTHDADDELLLRLIAAEAMFKGTARNIESEDTDSKNAVVG